ncbi:MAG: sigma-70 family RNA polymerase sigma factor [Sedimenticola sp.]
MKNPMQSNNLYQQFNQKILGFLSRFVNETEAQDLTQEVFIKVDANLDKFKGKSSTKTWIYKIATNTMKDYLKSKSYQSSKRHIPVSEMDLERYGDLVRPGTLLEDKLDTNEMNKCIKEFIYRIPVNYSSVLVLCDLEELNTKEVSTILEMSIGAVKVRLHRARARLKEELESGCMISTTCDNKILCERKAVIDQL